MSYICLSMYSPGFARYAIVSSANNNGFGSSFSHNPTSYFYFLLYPASYKRGPWGAQWNGNSQTEFSSSFGKDGCEIKKKKKVAGSSVVWLGSHCVMWQSHLLWVRA